MRGSSYPKPKEQGGIIIRKSIGLCRLFTPLPLQGTVTIACSGGADSTALAVMFSRYGRKVCLKDQIRLLHIDHAWNPKSERVARWVERLARQMGVGFDLVTARASEKPQPGESWESIGRELRRRAFEQQLRTYPGWILTAHQADDLAETLIWRFSTGQLQTHGEGIRVLGHSTLRPLLRIRRQEIEAFLKEESQRWLKDPSNKSSRFMRNRVRKQLLPRIESEFSRCVDHWVKQAIGLQLDRHNSHFEGALPLNESSHSPRAAVRLLQTLNLGLRRSHWESAMNVASDPNWSGELSLPEGWILQREIGPQSERWIAEKKLPPQNKA